MRLRRICSFGASAGLHGAAVLAIALIPPRVISSGEPGPAASGSTSMIAVARIDMNPRRDDTVLHGGPDAEGQLESTDQETPTPQRFEADLATLRARKNWLFPFLTTDLLFLERTEQELRSEAQRIIAPGAPARTRSSTRPPLAISQSELQAIVDRAWSRRERWGRFSEIAALAAQRDPDEGQLAELLHAYLDQNLLQPYYDTSTRDPRFWAMLACVADHVEFVDWIRSFTREHPSSRTTTELLFLLDELAQGSRDTLLMLLATDPSIHLNDTRLTHLAAYDLAVAVRSHYGDWLRQREMNSPGAIRRHYDDVRLRILATIVETTPNGYRISDAKFLAGEILFEQNNLSGALEWWRDMQPEPSDSYVLAAREILEELRSPRGPNPVHINRILGAQYRRWLDFSRDRLARFGYAFDTF